MSNNDRNHHHSSNNLPHHPARRQIGAAAATAATLGLTTTTYQHQPLVRRYQLREPFNGVYFDSEYYIHDQNFGILQWLGCFLVALCKLLLLFTVSAISYGIFYQHSMPAQHAAKELHFDYTGGGSSSGLLSTSPPITEQLPPPLHHHHHYTNPLALFRRQHQHYHAEGEEAPPEINKSSVPTATVDLLAIHNEWQAALDEVLPATASSRSRGARRLLHAGQAYFIEVSLTLPESQANKDAGIFGVITELYASSSEASCSATTSSDNNDKENHSQSCNAVNDDNNAKVDYHHHKLLAISRRSYRFPHQSAWIATIAKVLLLVPLLIGAFQETRTVTSPVFRQYIESADYPLQHVIVKIIQPQRHSSTPHLVEAIGGEIRIGEELSAFQELLKDWFYTCCFLGTFIFAIIYFVMLLLLGFIWEALNEKRRLRAELEEPPCDLDLDHDEDFDDIRFEDYADIPHDDDIGGGVEETADEQVEEHLGNEREHDSQRAAHAEVAEERGHVIHSSRFNDITSEDDEDDDSWEDLNYPNDTFSHQNVPCPVPSPFSTPLRPPNSLLQPTPVIYERPTNRRQERVVASSSQPTPERPISERPTTCRQERVVVQTVREMTDEELSVELLRRVQSDDDSDGPEGRHPFLFFLFG